MRAYGRDHLRQDGGQYILTSAIPKGWTARTPPSNLRTEHPGTAVLWDDRYYEVVSAEQLADGRCVYRLEPWRDEHVIRVSDAYDAASETRREAEHRAAIAREKNRVAANASAILTGHLPAIAQEHLASELGIIAHRMTLWSLIPGMVLICVVIHLHVAATVANRESPVPWMVYLLALYFAADTPIRFYLALSQNRPCGSAPGGLVYALWYALARNRRGLPSPFAERRGEKIFVLDPPDDVAVQDALRMRKALFTLLSPAEQRTLTRKWGYDHREDARAIAAILLVFSLLGTFSMFGKLAARPSVTALLSLACAIYVAGEQLWRLGHLGNRPMGSVLAPLVRPLARRFL